VIKDPLKQDLGLRKMAVAVLKTGRRIWVTVYMDLGRDVIPVDEFMEIKNKLRAAAREVYDNTDTDVILERV
jgi:hypothetical protein